MKSKIDNSDWQDLFEALTGQSNFTVIEEEKRVLLLETKDSSLFKKIEHILSSPANIEDKLNLVLKKTNRDSSLEEKKFESYSPDPLVDGFSIFSRLLEFSSPKVKQSLIFEWDITTNLDYLIEDLSEVPDLIPMRKIAINLICLFLKKLSFAQLHMVLSTRVFKPSSVDKESKSEGPLAAMVEKILFFDEQKKAVIFDHNLFITCLTPPKVQIQESISEGGFQIRFASALQLLNYLRTSVGTNFIIKTDESDSEQKSGHIIAFGDVSTTTTAISRPIHFHYPLDCSESMNWRNDQEQTFDETLFPQVLEISKKFAEKIAKIATTSTQFSIYPIKGASEGISVHSYKIKDAKALEDCNGFIDTLKANSHTNLYGVLLYIFQYINQHPECDHVVAGLTDGEDQNQPLRKQALFKQIAKICTDYKASPTPPQIFMITIGRNVAKQLTQELLPATQATVVEVEQHDEVEKLFDYFRQMNLPMKVIDVFVKMHTEVKAQARVSVFAGHPKSLKNLRVGEGQTVELDGAKYLVSCKSSRKEILSDKRDSLLVMSHQPDSVKKGQNIVREYPLLSRRYSYPP